jgi:hypothetical protein
VFITPISRVLACCRMRYCALRFSMMLERPVPGHCV